MKSKFLIASACSIAVLVSAGLTGKALAETGSEDQLPNILFIVMDDVGIDQMKVFGYGGKDPAHTPNIDTVALAGIRFRNTWAHPTCSASRASFFDGRFNIRTNVNTAITGSDLANSQLSPYEFTTPEILRRRNYQSAVFGKMHLSGSEINPATNPFGNEVMRKLGWDHFEGFLDGGPYPIDTTAGGVGGSAGSGKTNGCGFVPNTSGNPQIGADSGACYTNLGKRCVLLSTAKTATPGKACLERGGIFDPETLCQSEVPSYINFNTQNAYYTGNWVINDKDHKTRTLPPADPGGRGYRTVQEADRTIQWINKQNKSGKPWMASLGFSAIHDPVQPPPARIVSPRSPNTDGFNCATSAENREMATQMLEGIDHEIGRLLVETGLARYNQDGSLDYQPDQTNTMVVILGDNGTWTTSVRAPFDPARAKGTPYQTGVWVPQIIAGPLVKEPGRQVSHMTNGTDLFTFFGEIAGIDVRKVVPKSHVLDSKKLLPYLRNPAQHAIRKTNFTLQANNLVSTTTPQYPCLITSINICTLVLPTQGVCADQGGEWFGPGGVVSPASYTNCCQVNDYLVSVGKPAATNNLSQSAIRNRNYKLIQTEVENCSSTGAATTLVNEFYRISSDRVKPKVDFADENLLKSGAAALSRQQQSNFSFLLRELTALQNSITSCPGDGNLDKVVNQKDLSGWSKFSSVSGATTANGGGQSSWFDFNLDGLTDEADKQIIQSNFGKKCN